LVSRFQFVFRWLCPRSVHFAGWLKRSYRAVHDLVRNSMASTLFMIARMPVSLRSLQANTLANVTLTARSQPRFLSALLIRRRCRFSSRTPGIAPHCSALIASSPFLRSASEPALRRCGGSPIAPRAGIKSHPKVALEHAADAHGMGPMLLGSLFRPAGMLAKYGERASPGSTFERDEPYSYFLHSPCK
jgi:hypothetical protein